MLRPWFHYDISLLGREIASMDKDMLIREHHILIVSYCSHPLWLILANNTLGYLSSPSDLLLLLLLIKIMNGIFTL